MPSDVVRYGNTGVDTIEGNVAGYRARKLTEEHKKQQNEYENKKNQLQQKEKKKLFDKPFIKGKEEEEMQFKIETIGLLTAKEFRRKKEEVYERNKSRIGKRKGEGDEGNGEEDKGDSKGKEKQKKKQREKKKVKTNLLSFKEEDEDEDDENNTGDEKNNKTTTKPKIMKNPDVNTSQLPDRERDEQLQHQRKEYEKEWYKQQEKIKEEFITITYSYWNGMGHRKSIKAKQKTTIKEFLNAVILQLRQEFPELKNILVDNLMYIKEDIIIPHEYSFYDLILTKAKGKSGALFQFDVFDDVRIQHDASVEKNESHAGKIVTKSWYEANKHIFPASRWEVVCTSM